ATLNFRGPSSFRRRGSFGLQHPPLWPGFFTAIVTRGEDIRLLPFPYFLIVAEALRLQLSPYPQYVALSSPHEGDVPVQVQVCQFQFGLGRLKSEAELVGVRHSSEVLEQGL